MNESMTYSHDTSWGDPVFRCYDAVTGITTYRIMPREDDAALLDAVLAPGSGFYVWTPGTPLLLTSSEA